MKYELCRCRFCGGEAEVSPAKKEDFTEKYNNVRVSCSDCGAVDVWALALQERTFNYKKLRAVAEQRWNKLMGGNDEADRISM